MTRNETLVIMMPSPSQFVGYHSNAMNKRLKTAFFVILVASVLFIWYNAYEIGVQLVELANG